MFSVCFVLFATHNTNLHSQLNGLSYKSQYQSFSVAIQSIHLTYTCKLYMKTSVCVTSISVFKCTSLTNRTMTVSFFFNSNEFYTQSLKKKFTVFSFYQTSFLFNLMILIPFLASLIRHHRPSLCSWPIPATNTCPSGEKARLFTKPTYIKGKKPLLACWWVSFITCILKNKNQSLKKVIIFLCVDVQGRGGGWGSVQTPLSPIPPHPRYIQIY